MRDVALTGLALYGVWHEEHKPAGEVSGLLLLTYVVILGLVPAAHALALVLAPSRGLSSTPDTPPATVPSPQSSAL